MKIIYLGAYKALHPNYDIIYQDINGKRDLDGDMLDVDLTPYDVIIATPPCNYWSRANYRRETSLYALNTKHLLPNILDKLIKHGKPFIVENVRNRALMTKNNIFNRNCYVIEHGRHTYFTNILFKVNDINQVSEFLPTRRKIGHKQFIDDITGKIYKSNCTLRVNNNTQGGDNVHKVIERFLETVKELTQ